MKKLRVGVLAAGIVALIGLAAPPANAVTSGQFEMVAGMQFPMSGYPVLTAPSFGGLYIASSVCDGTEANVNKLGKAPIVAGTCSLRMTGTWGSNAVGLGGHCTAAGGTLSGTFVDANSTQIAMSGTYEIDGTQFQFVGLAHKPSTGQTGPATITGTIAWPAADCLANHATTATLVASGTFALA